ncbi:MAG: tetratricopeptide repeat protein [Chloracidobacterium sp.]|nr:tetratricopeptide repeat protein [Chloracidobacterium sp.]
MCSFSALAQPDDVQQKQIAGKAAFDEAIKLRQENTFKSYQLALENFQLSATIYGEIGDKANVGSALLGAGLIKNLLFENDVAFDLYNQALAIFREIGNKGLEARTLNNLGLLYDETGNKQKAIEYHNLALPLRKITGDKYGEANTLNSLGSVYSGLGERAKALDYYKRALAIQIETDDKRAQGITLSNIGRAYDDIGDKTKAQEYLERSLALRRAVGDKAGEATTLNNLGMVTSDLGDKKKAAMLYEQALAILTEIGFENRKAAVLGNLSVVYLDLNEPKKALDYNRQSIPLYRAMDNKQGEATALNNLGFANASLGDTTSALNDLNSALVMARSVNERGLEAIILGNLMHVSKQVNRPAVAVIYGKQCIATYQELRRAITDLDRSTQSLYLKSVADNYRFLADLLIEMGRFAEAEEVLQMLKEEEFSEFVRRDADEIKSLNRRVKLTDKEKSLVDKYTLLANRASELGEQFKKLDDRKRLLSRREQTLSFDEEKLYQQLAAQITEANAAFRLFLEKDLVAELGTENVRQIEIDRSLQDKLRKWGNGTVALYTVVTENRYRVVLTTPTVQIDGKTDISAALLNKKIFAFTKAVKDPDVDSRPLGKEIYDILIKPIEKDLIASGAKTLLWSLDGTLRYLPLTALSPDGKAFMVEKYQNVILTPRTRDSLADSTAEWKALGMGVSEGQMVTYPDQPEQKQKVEPLPGTKDELTAIVRDENNPSEKGILSGRRFLDKDFTLKNFTDSLAAETADGKRKFTVIHLASHFHLGSSWSNSYLFMGNGKLLTLEELSGSPQINFGDVELVTLSACNTALGGYANGREVESLAGAIQAKSGKAVLATLWAVSDRSTPQLMSDFYRFRKEKPGTTKAEALQQAQRKMIASATKTAAGFSHPYFWSGFVLIGNWR